ncbi:MAG: cytochrome c3 family protein [Planctomycetota bacterium]
MQKQTSFMGVALALVVLLVGTSSVFAQGACTDCHNDTTVITAKKFAMEVTNHGNGTAAAYAGGRGSCTACHSGASFSAMVAAGQTPAEFRTVTAVTRQDCRTCHQIHVTSTAADWALETTAPVNLYAFGELNYDGGKGNLCANCHQPRRVIDGYVDDANGVTNVTSTHWGPHHGPQSAILLGTGGAGDVPGVPSFHYRLVGDTCVSCHVGPDASHSFAAVESTCLDCHAEDEDLDGAQAAIDAKITELHDLLEAKGLYHDGHPVVGTYPTAEAQALWNYILIAVEDASSGAHNMPYINALLDASIAALQ